MNQRTVNGTTYYPRTHKEKGVFYPVIGFSSPLITDNYYLSHHGQATRSKARTIAINHIKNIKP